MKIEILAQYKWNFKMSQTHGTALSKEQAITSQR